MTEIRAGVYPPTSPLDDNEEYERVIRVRASSVRVTRKKGDHVSAIHA